MTRDASGSGENTSAMALLDELALGRSDADLLAEALMTELEPIAPSGTLRAALLDATARPGRLARFAAKLAAMVDVSLDKAHELLERVTRAELWERDLVPGLEAIWVEGGPAVAQCVRGFARLAAGREFPEHHHLGRETMLILEGAMIDSSGAVVRPGETYVMEAGTTHSYRAAPGGTDLLFFTVVREGITIGDGEVRHRDPV